MSSSCNIFNEVPAALGYFCEAHQKTKPFKTSFNAHLTANVAVLAGILGNIVKIELSSGYSVYPNLYSYIIGNSGQGKSGYLSHGYGLISNIQKIKNKKHKEAKKERFNSKKKREEENSQRKLEGLKPLPKTYEKNFPEGVFNNKYPLCTMDFTIEGMQQDMSERTGGNFFVVRDELMGTFKTLKKQGRQNDISFLNDAYEPVGESYEITRKMDAAKVDTIYNMSLNILGTIQTAGIRSQLKDYLKEGVADAFFARFQNISILPIEDEDQDYKPLNKDATYAFEKLIQDIVEERVRCSKIDPCDFTPKMFSFTEEAEQAYIDFSKNIRKVNREQKNILFHEHLCKTATFLLKICLIFHVLEKPFGMALNAYSDLISFDTVKKAIKYVNEKVETAKVLYGVDEEVNFDIKKQAEDLYNYLQDTQSKFYQNYIKKGWNLRALRRTSSKYLPRKNNNCVDDEMLESLLEYLEDEGKILSFSFLNPHNNQPITTYSILPQNALEKDKAHVEELITRFTKEITAEQTETEDPKPKKPPEPKREVKKYKKFSLAEMENHSERVRDAINLREFILKHYGMKGSVNSNAKICCPFHNDTNPSFSVTKTQYNCHSKCGGGDIFKLISLQEGLNYKADFPKILRIAERYAGIEPLNSSYENDYTNTTDSVLAEKKLQEEKDQKKTEQIHKIALKTWREATLDVDRATYLSNRLKDYSVPLNDSLRYSKSVYYKDEEITGNFPALLAKITNLKGEFTGLQRIYLNDEMTSKRDLAQNKKIIGNLGNGFVNLVDSEEADTVVIGEGIETVLSLYLILERDETIDVSRTAVYANLSATNIPELSERFKTIFVARDNDEAGEKYTSNIKAKYKDREVIVPELPEEYNDFNDLFLAEGG